MRKAIIVFFVAFTLLFGACGVLPDYSTDVANQSPDVSETPEPDISIEAVVEGEKIITGENEAQDSEKPENCELFVSQSVTNSIKAKDNAGAYFYVQLTPYFSLGEDFEYEGRIYDTWRNVPELEAYNQEYELWLQDVFPALDEQMKAAEDRGETQAQGWSEKDPRDYFDVYYEHTQSEEVISAWKAAKDKVLEAQSAYDEWRHSDECYEMEYELLKNETVRLIEQDYIIELSGWDIVGYLTSEQIEEFNCGDYAYTITWAKEDA